MMLHNTQSVIERKAKIINFLSLLLGGSLVNHSSSKDALFSIEEGRLVLSLLFEARSGGEEAGPGLGNVWNVGENVIFLYRPVDLFLLKGIRESTWGRHNESHVDFLDLIADTD